MAEGTTRADIEKILPKKRRKAYESDAYMWEVDNYPTGYNTCLKDSASALANREASAEELERLFQQRGAFRLELRGVSGSSKEDFDYRRLNDYFQRIRSQETPDMGDKDAWQTLLVNTEFLVDEDDTTPQQLQDCSCSA